MSRKELDRLSSERVPLAATASLAAVVAAIGTQRFADALLQSLAPFVVIDQIAAVIALNDAPPQLLAVAGRTDPSAARSFTRDYLARFYQDDPIFQKLLERSWSREVVVLRHNPAETTAEYEQRFFSSSGLVDKVAYLWRRGAQAYYVNFYRAAELGCFTPRDITRFKALASLVAGLFDLHAGKAVLTAALGARSPDTLIAAAVAVLDPRLTAREQEVLTHILRGLPVDGIASICGLKRSSVATLRQRAYAKLGISTQAELFSRCLALVAGASDGARSRIAPQQDGCRYDQAGAAEHANGAR